MRSFTRASKQRISGQTVLEYALVTAVIVLPIGAAIRDTLEENDTKKSIIYHLLKDSYGGKGQPGVIGRPYP
jgi:hypothetical protein